MLNLFLALLLSSFGASNLSSAQVDSDTNKLAEAFNRIARFKAWIRRGFVQGFRMLRSKLTNQISDQRPPGQSDRSPLLLLTITRFFVRFRFCFCVFSSVPFSTRHFSLFFLLLLLLHLLLLLLLLLALSIFSSFSLTLSLSFSRSFSLTLSIYLSPSFSESICSVSFYFRLDSL